MAKKTSVDLLASSQAPIFFADQPAGLAVGPHVSRLTFGVEDDESDYPRPVVTVAIPTIALLALIDDLNYIVDSPNFKKDITASLLSSAERIAKGRKSVPSKALHEISVQKKRSTKTKALTASK